MPPLRPRVHFTPRANWINDPNGLVYAGGAYHLFCQFNPRGLDHGYMSWGHATSRDLLHWQEHDVALPWREGHDVFSGSAFVDWLDTGGFARPGDPHPPVIAMYTGNAPDHQAQYLAVSRDAGTTWTFATPEPVLDEGKADFRDPKTFWHAPSGQWVSVVAHPHERQVGLYGSADLRTWAPLSTFGPAGVTEGIWEVPDLFPLREPGGQERWVLKVDTFQGGPQGGCGAQYWVGDFDGVTFTPATPARWADWGRDFYAAITYADLPAEQDRTVWIGWLNNWSYATRLPTTPWRGMMTLPRELGLSADLTLTQVPVRELEARRGAALAPDGDSLALPPGQAVDLTLTATGEFTLTLTSAAGEEAALFLEGSALHLRRPAPPEAPDFAGTHAAPLPDGAFLDGRLDLRVVLDTLSVEVFAAGGRLSFTHGLLPTRPVTGLGLSGAVQGEGWVLT